MLFIATWRIINCPNLGSTGIAGWHLHDEFTHIWFQKHEVLIGIEVVLPFNQIRLPSVRQSISCISFRHTLELTDPAYNPCWRQGSYVIPFISRIGLISSLYSWSLGIKLNIEAHISLSLLFILAAFWHWAYSDLNVFARTSYQQVVLDLNKILGIHFIIWTTSSSYLMPLGPGMWTCDLRG